MQIIPFDEKSISYNFNLALHPGKMYEGISEIKFHIANYEFDSKDFFLDFQGKSV